MFSALRVKHKKILYHFVVVDNSLKHIMCLGFWFNYFERFLCMNTVLLVINHAKEGHIIELQCVLDLIQYFGSLHLFGYRTGVYTSKIAADVK